MTKPDRIDNFLAMHSTRTDSWRNVHSAARSWAAGSGSKAATEAALAEIAVIEEFHAFPGIRLMNRLRDRLAAGEAAVVADLVRQYADAILTGRYTQLTEADGSAEGSDALPEVLPSVIAGRDTRRPYFEVLLVSPQPPARWPAICAELRRLRRVEDAFVYEPVIVGSFEDAICAAIVNPKILSVIAAEGAPFRSRHDAPVLRRIIEQTLGTVPQHESALMLAGVLKGMRPDLDIYVTSDRDVETLASDPKAACARRIFYAVEELLELHLAILEGIQERYETPFFNNLKKYAQRPIGTFHALPIARGKSVFRSDWIRDMGEFYGINLFLAESSATTGGLDSLLEPTGNIKKAQSMAARAFGADHVFFVTNGTSTSNKMVVQALVAPGDIVIVDRNCHKSHHYGMVLTGGQPLYVEAFPLTAYSMYGAVPLAAIKKALLDLRDEGRLDRVKLLDLTNCTFDGHMYNTRRVMEECLAIKPDLIFLWDEAWSGFARWSPFLRPRTGMGAAEAIDVWLHDPASVAAYEAQQKALGDKPSRETLMSTRLIPDPRKVRLRVYQTNSTHKSMSAIRQGSMVLVRDVDYGKVESQFHEAVFTHASTSPNQQLIASLDVARRQMELEGYGLVMNAISIALKIRQIVNNHPLISKYFRILGADELIPAEFRKSGFTDYLTPGTNWADVITAMREDEFYLDPTRMTMVCGTAGFDGTQFKGILADRFDIQVNKTSRNSVLLQSNINNTRSDIAHLVRVLMEISTEIEGRLADSGAVGQEAFARRTKSLMTDVPDLPNFSRFHDAFRKDAGKHTPEGDMRSAFFAAYNEAACEYVALNGAEIDARLKKGPDLVSANFVIPYPPGFPIMVPGQVLTQETIDFMRKLDVKEIHGYEAAKGLKLIRPGHLKTAGGK
ncbi:MAG: decarboxylase [Rhodobacter sp.]|nr:decarboxylase [Rhodobacter sp.]MCA3459687.1 decarboxylase [Rhodobacter sp.]MCA3464347.1 decarboxylase [Rhodobacter sp.]MCA3467659.1 decarboxylase [Rhodobacter sp.]MCA3470477.1 decarboxylase [Rhodobacter sp.]